MLLPNCNDNVEPVDIIEILEKVNMLFLSGLSRWPSFHFLMPLSEGSKTNKMNAVPVCNSKTAMFVLHHYQ